MNDSNIYVGLWKKYKPAIVSKMKNAINEPQSFNLTKYEFEALGKREESGYAFNLEIKDGKLNNNIEGTAVARDLLIVLKESKTFNEFIEDYDLKINMDVNFVLKINAVKK